MKMYAASYKICDPIGTTHYDEEYHGNKKVTDLVLMGRKGTSRKNRPQMSKVSEKFKDLS